MCGLRAYWAFLVVLLLLQARQIKCHSEAEEEEGTHDEECSSIPRQGRTRLKDVEVKDFNERSAVLGVFSSGTAEKFAERRRLIRLTWGSFLYSLQLELVFVLGRGKLSEAQLALVQSEIEAYNDIVLVDNDDSETFKSMKVFQYILWAAGHRPEAAFIAKLDEDLWLHPYRFKQLLATLPTKLCYWGLLKRSVDRRGYAAGQIWVWSKDMAAWVARMEMQLMHAPMYTQEVDPALLVGKMASAQGMTVNMIEVVAAKNFEVYDWGPDADPEEINEDADFGLPPSETIAVHRLKDSNAFLKVHDWFVGSLMRWKTCVTSNFVRPFCLKLLQFEESLRV